MQGRTSDYVDSKTRTDNSMNDARGKQEGDSEWHTQKEQNLWEIDAPIRDRREIMVCFQLGM